MLRCDGDFLCFVVLWFFGFWDMLGIRFFVSFLGRSICVYLSLFLRGSVFVFI